MRADCQDASIVRLVSVRCACRRPEPQRAGTGQTNGNVTHLSGGAPLPKGGLLFRSSYQVTRDNFWNWIITRILLHLFSVLSLIIYVSNGRKKKAGDEGEGSQMWVKFFFNQRRLWKQRAYPSFSWSVGMIEGKEGRGGSVRPLGWENERCLSQDEE